MKTERRTNWTLLSLAVVLLALTAGFLLNLWGHPPAPGAIPPVDPEFLKTTTVRQSYADLIRAKADLSDFDCYACHEKGKPPTLRFDENHNLVIPKEHPDIVMAHGQHNRNNICFNCHDENNLELLQTRDGRQLKMADSAPLCGSCHGPTYRDWEAGAHGRTGGYWNTALGPPNRQICVSCHNPHSPKFPGRKPAPGPNRLHPTPAVETARLATKHTAD
jgi:formate-dependent nitrite reductase cytochrome c552 subunit